MEIKMSAVDPLELHEYQQLQEKVKANGIQSLTEEDIALIQKVESSLGDQLDEELERYGKERMLGFGLAILGIIFINTPMLSVILMLAGAYFVTGLKTGRHQSNNRPPPDAQNPDDQQ